MDGATQFRRIRYQSYALLSCVFSIMSVGNIIAWMSPFLLYVKINTSSEFPVTSVDIRWMVALTFLGIMVGPIIFAIIVDKIGRKWINFFASAVYMIGWACSIFASSAEYILASRFILGIGIGFTLCIVPVYIGEVIENHLRGAFIAALLSALIIGFLNVYILSAFVNFKILSSVCLLYPIASLLTFFMMPESPHFHVMNNKYTNAEKNLMRLRGEKDRIDVIEELADIIEYLKDGFTGQPIGTKLKLLQLKKAMFPLLIVTVLIFTQCFSGVLVIMGTIHLIINDPDVDSYEEYTGVIISGCIGFISSLVTIFLVDKLGRRTLFFVSSGGCVISTALIGTFYYLEDYTTYSWLSVFGVFTFQFFFHFGLGHIPCTVGSEIFPAFIRPWTTAFMVTTLGLFGFIVTKLYFILGENFGYFVPFWTFSVSICFGMVFIYFYMPETKQKSIAEIQEAFQTSEILKQNNDKTTAKEKQTDIQTDTS